MQLLFEWDPAKAASNLKKHGVDFETAARVFQDPLALALLDESHQQQEERWATLGQVDNHKLVVVIHTWRENDATIRVRIISARRATKREERQYQGDIEEVKQMREEYDFSKAERGKFYRPDAALSVPVYLDQALQTRLSELAQDKGVELSTLVNALLKKDLELIEMAR